MRIFSLFIIAMAVAVGCNSGSSGKPSVEGITEDGFKYNIYKTGSSNQIAKAGQYIYFTSGVLLDDDSELQPVSDIVRMQIPSDTAVLDPFQQNPVIDILKQMSPGDSANVYVDLDSIPQAKMQFPENKFINNYFIVESIVDEEVALDDIAREQQENMIKMQEAQNKASEVDSLVTHYLAEYKKGALENDLQKLEDGLEIFTVKSGSGDEIGNGAIQVHYWGVLKEDGSMFDNSYQRGQAFPLNVGAGSVIKGWDVGVAKLHKGEEALLFIPSEMGYGENGAGEAIPPNADLVFFVEVLKN